MTTRPVVIRRTATVEEAEIIAAWLSEQGIKATVLDQASPGVFAFGVTDDEGVAIAVADEDTARRAASLLEEHDRRHVRTGAASAAVEIVCEACQTVNRFPGHLRGMVQECTECGGFIDVPNAT